MVHIRAIDEALVEGDLDVLENTFARLLDPAENCLDGVTSPSELDVPMRRVCEALVHDTKSLPERTAKLAEEYTPPGSSGAGDYATAARRVLDHFGKWTSTNLTARR
jgi:hypothetical protein